MRFGSADSWSKRTRPRQTSVTTPIRNDFVEIFPTRFEGGASLCGRSSGARCHCCNVRKAHSRSVRAFVSGQIGYNNSLKGDQIGLNNQRRIMDEICDFHDTLHVTLTAQLGYDGWVQERLKRSQERGQAGRRACRKVRPAIFKAGEIGRALASNLAI